MSEFSWIDYDPEHSQAMRTILATLRQREARDELGLGAIRDSFADLFFPGTSTIHRRLRYLLFVPWCLQAAERVHTDLPRALRRAELGLLKQLRHLGEGAGVIGLASGETLVAWPSSIYWSALRSWGIFKGAGSLANWPAAVRAASGIGHPREDEVEGLAHALWDPGLPRPSAGFLEAGHQMDFTLLAEEVAYLRRRLDRRQFRPDGDRHNLIRLFDRTKLPKDCEAPWEHPKAFRLSNETVELLQMAKTFSGAMYGATILYNLLLARQLTNESGKPEAERWMENHVEYLAKWQATIDRDEIGWLHDRLGALFDLPAAMGRGLTEKTRAFVRQWLDLVAHPRSIDDRRAHELVRNREMDVKKRSGNSRFASQRARQAWNGNSGVRMTYRWDIARVYLRDLGNG